jgi:hypothetical protein
MYGVKSAPKRKESLEETKEPSQSKPEKREKKAS